MSAAYLVAPVTLPRLSIRSLLASRMAVFTETTSYRVRTHQTLRQTGCEGWRGVQRLTGSADTGHTHARRWRPGGCQPRAPALGTPRSRPRQTGVYGWQSPPIVAGETRHFALHTACRAGRRILEDADDVDRYRAPRAASGATAVRSWPGGLGERAGCSNHVAVLSAVCARMVWTRLALLMVPGRHQSSPASAWPLRSPCSRSCMVCRSRRPSRSPRPMISRASRDSSRLPVVPAGSPRLSADARLGS